MTVFKVDNTLLNENIEIQFCESLMILLEFY